MDAKIKQVAAALVRSRNGGVCRVTDWLAEARDNPTIAQAWEDARAAIEAMRGPTPGMLEVGWDAANERDPNCLEWIHEPIYDAMIDAAMKEGE